jgi:hypothetical protein
VDGAAAHRVLVHRDEAAHDDALTTIAGAVAFAYRTIAYPSAVEVTSVTKNTGEQARAAPTARL